MNQDKVKEKLLKLHDYAEEFTVFFTGKRNNKVNGFYRYDKREILINNRNFGDGENIKIDLLFYTAIHEAAHHIQFTELHQQSVRSHTALFYFTLDNLIDIAEKKGLYKMPIDADIQALIYDARKKSCGIAVMQRELGEVLVRLNKVCRKKGVLFEDVIERKVQISRNTAQTVSKAHSLGLPAEIGADLQLAVIQERNKDKRDAMIRAGMEGKSIEQAKYAIAVQSHRYETVYLMKEKRRLEGTMESLKRRLELMSEQLQSQGDE